MINHCLRKSEKNIVNFINIVSLSLWLYPIPSQLAFGNKCQFVIYYLFPCICISDIFIILIYIKCRGSAIAKIIGTNAARLDSLDSCVKMWVYEEMIDGKKLTEIINTTHENVKYLPGKKLPENVVCNIMFLLYTYLILVSLFYNFINSY